MKQNKNKVVKRSAATIIALLFLIISVLAVGIGAGVYIYTTTHSSSQSGGKSHHSSSHLPPDSTAGYGQSGSSAVASALEARQNRTQNEMESVIYGSEGSSDGSWSVRNPDMSLTKQYVIYECTASSQTQKQADGTVKTVTVYTPTQAIGETPILGPGQHVATVKWFKPLSGSSRVVCAQINCYDPDTNAYLGSSLATKLSLVLQ